jgi:methylmalonyl-CoA/ethylmalonyl-CoA epimerase
MTVGDLDRSIEFYRDVLGLPFVARFGDLAFFDLDGVRLLLERGGDREARPVLYLRVADLHEAYADLRARGLEFVDEPHIVFTDAAGTFGDPNEAEWMVFFEDPDGQLLALSSREPAGRRRASTEDQ